ncbi:DnaB-like helicase C-terminal domain-containing protein [Shigella flexneri]
MNTEEIQKLRKSNKIFNWENWNLVTPLENHEWSLLPCPKCFHKEGDPLTVFANSETGDFHCEKCGYIGNATKESNKFKGKLNFKTPWWKRELKPTIIKWFEKHYISEDTLRSLDISVVEKQYFPQLDANDIALAIPCRKTKDGEIQDVHYIRIDPKGSFLKEQTTTLGAKNIPLGLDHIDYNHVVVVDNIKDYLAFYESGQTSVICLPNNLDPLAPDNNTWEFLSNIENEMKQVKKFTFAFPNSERGFAIEEEISRRFGKDRGFRVRWQREVDHILEPSAFDIFIDHGEDSLEEEIDEAKPFPIKGIYEVDDVADRIDAAYDFGLKRGLSTGFPTLDNHYTVELGQWTLLTGIPGSGKSNFLDGLLVNLSKLHGWKHAIFSPENQPIDRYFSSLIEKAVGKAFNKTSNPSQRMTRAELDEWKAWTNKYFKVILPDEEEGNWSIDGILDLAKAAVYRYGIKSLVIDPWNEIDHKRPSGMTETEYISSALTKVRRFAKAHNVHVFIIAHPVKMTKKEDGKYPVPTPYDVAGGAHWRNKADNALTVHRNVGQIDEDISDIHIQKIRFKEIGKVGLVSLRADMVSGCYFDDIDQQKRAISLGSATPFSSKEIRLNKPLNLTHGKMTLENAKPSIFENTDEIFKSL